MSNLKQMKIMHDYESLSPDSRVWVYQANRELNDTEVPVIKKEVSRFVTEWVAHQKALKGWGDVLYNRFIVLMVDETDHMASGCSIDSSVHFLKELEHKYKLNLFDRLMVAFEQGESIKVAHKDSLGEMLADNSITEDTTVFNNLLDTKADFEQYWKIPLRDSWVKQVV